MGRRMGADAKPGQIYTLNGDLGAGKTIFTKGMAAGLGIEEPVSSPTFTIAAAGFRCITLMCTGSVNRKRWKRSDMMIIFSERESA